jgi:hypothetical protein
MQNKNDMIDVVTQSCGDPELVLKTIDLIRRRLLGIILVDNIDNPRQYWADLSCPATVSGEILNPLCFASLKRAERTRRRLRQQYDEEWHPVLWMHPECHLIPLDKYQTMQRQFPGCPVK